MSPSDTAELRFNALTDPWLPLIGLNGATVWASPVDVLSGEKDAADLDYPRDDFRIYARLLLSALVQALLPANTKSELRDRLEKPLSRAEIEARFQPLLSDFNLFGPRPFLQTIPTASDQAKKGGAARFVFGDEDLYQPRVRVDAISVPVALVTLFVEQTYAGGAGRGYGAGPGGQPGAFTLIDPGTLRRAAWANTLTLDRVAQKYTEDGERPWSNAKVSPRPRASIGIVGGLFFQPRSIWLVPAGYGVCSLAGHAAPLVRLAGFQPKSELTKKSAQGDDTWQHPCAPMAVNSQGIAAIRLSAERPAWTGLAQLLEPLSKQKTKLKHPLEGPAPVLTQWKDLGYRAKHSHLLVLDFDRNKANIKRRFFEAFPITSDLLHKPDAVERLRALVQDAQAVERALLKGLSQAHDRRKLGGLALADARTTFWATSEGPFLTWLSAIVALDEENGDWELANRQQMEMSTTLRRAARAIFDTHAAMSEFDPRKQEQIAKARRWLHRTLKLDGPAHSQSHERIEVNA